MRALPAFIDNYIWAWIDAGALFVVDPGDATPVRALVQAEGLRLGGILITHHHPDHVGGVAALHAEWPEAPIWGPANSPFTGSTQELADGDRVQVGSTAFAILHTPGHTLDHICYFHPQALFCGDTLFAAGCGRLFEGDAAQMHASLQRLAALPGQTPVYCTHEYTLANLRFAAAAAQDGLSSQRLAAVEALRAQGEISLPSSIAEECRSNPFLRVVDPEFRAQLSQQGLDAADAEQAFASLRAWKDRF